MKSGKKIEFAPYCYLVPSMLIFAVFLFYPFFKTIYLSLFMTNKMGQAKLFVGLNTRIPGNALLHNTAATKPSNIPPTTTIKTKTTVTFKLF